MRTKKPIATISYNSLEFLIPKLETLVKNHVLSDYMLINHFAEEDENKNHIHLWLNPNTLVDSMTLQEEFTEFDFANPLKPLKCIDFRLSDVDEWILYCSHFAPYLASKGESRQYHYIKDDFIFHDEDTFNELWNHAFKGSKWAERNAILAQIKDDNLSPATLILNGTIPLNMASQLNALKYMQRTYGTTERGEHDKHE